MNLLFLGLPGCWVRETAQAAAERLHLRFVDTDEVLARNLSLSLQEVYSLFTPDAMRDLLGRLAGQLSAGNGYCIAVGDCLLDDRGAMETLTAPGYTVFLRLTPDAAAEICTDPEHPVLRRGLSRLKELYEDRRERLESYADLILDAEGQTPDMLAAVAERHFIEERPAREAEALRQEALDVNRSAIVSLLEERAHLLDLTKEETARFVAAVSALMERDNDREEN